MPNVYISNRGCHNFSAAEKFGTLVILTSGKVDTSAMGAMFRIFEMALEGSSPDDFILIAGPSTLSSLLCAMFAHKHGQLNMLIYQTGSDKKGHYRKRTIMFGGNYDEEANGQHSKTS